MIYFWTINQCLRQRMTPCYVCLESCDQVSPCDCRSSIHVQCMHEMRKQMTAETCTICKTPFHCVPPPIHCVLPPTPPPIPTTHRCCSLFYLFFLYCMIGWLVKCILISYGVIVANFAAFWTWQHFLCTFPIGVVLGGGYICAKTRCQTVV